MTVKVSTDYRRLSPEEAAALAAELADSWKAPEIPMRQWVGVVRGEIERYRNGEAQPHFEVLIRALKSIPVRAYRPLPSLLDVGASSGFYREILSIGGFQCDYVGLDYSEAYAALARELFPGIVFRVGDATALPFADGAFDIVLSGCCMLHIPDYPKVVSEAARVASGNVVFNRTPVLFGTETACYEKTAYGIPCIEWHFNEAELLGLFIENGLEVVSAEDSYSDPENNYCHRTYLTRKSVA